MPVALRDVLLVSAAAALSGCASGAVQPAPIDFRTPAVSGIQRTVTPGAAMAGSTAPVPDGRFAPAAPETKSAAAPVAADPPVYQLVADLGPSTGVPAVAEARALTPLPGARPGGARRLAPDDLAARTIQIGAGDTVYDISRRYAVNMRALIETNLLEPPYTLAAGTAIVLPPPNIHVVEKGETLYSVSRRYNVDTRSLALLNEMARPWTVWPGDQLLLPPLARDQSRDLARAVPDTPGSPLLVAAATPPPKPAPARPPVAAAPGPKPNTTLSSDKPIQLAPAAVAPAAAAPSAKPPTPAAAKPPATPPPPAAKPAPPKPAAPASTSMSTPSTSSSASRDFIWPVSGSVLRGFGPGPDGVRNDGVNIAAPKGAVVRAAAGGEVVYAGSELAGFGNLILIRHPGGWVTAYAHADSMLVKEGDLVKQGQPIASAGQTGNATSPQVHFELRKGKEPVDPRAHLPPLQG